jgi:hypothetical protein
MTFRPFVTNETERKAARKILRGRGLPTSEVHRLSYQALSDRLGDMEESAWRTAVEWAGQHFRPVPGPKDAPSSSVPVPKEQAEAQAEAEAQAKAGAKDGTGKSKSDGQSPDALEARVRQIFAEAAAEAKPEDEKPAIDEDAVRKVAEDVVRKSCLPSTVKVILPDATERTVEGTAHYRMPLILQALAAKCHLWLPGPAGSGKSTAGRQAFEALGYSEPVPGEDATTPKRIHMSGAIETPFQLTGYRSPQNDPATLMTPFRKAWQYGGAFIFDDVDRSNPKALAAFNEALANGHCAFPDGVVKAHDDFLCIATANTFGLGGGTDYVGAARLDKATLDRFVYIEIPYDENQERAIAGPDGAEWCAFVQKVRKAVHGLGLKHLVTPRATYKGLRLLAAGMKRAAVEPATVYAGLDAETLKRVKGAL